MNPHHLLDYNLNFTIYIIKGMCMHIGTFVV